MTQVENDTGAPDRAVRFSRRLSLTLIGGLLFAVLAATGAGYWLAKLQDSEARTALQRMLTGAIDAFETRSQHTALDYAVWTEAYENIVAQDLDWLYGSIGCGVDLGTFDAVVMVPPRATPYGWIKGGGAEPVENLLDPAIVAQLESLLDGVPIDSETAHATYLRTRGALWYMVIARTVPQDGIPAGLTDPDLPRQIFGYRITPELLAEIGSGYLIDDLALVDRPLAHQDAIPLQGRDGAPVGQVVWSSPTPGAALMRAALGPILGVVLLVAAVALHATRELVASARRLERALFLARAADRSKSEFLANVTHELRTPLNGIIGIAQLLQLHDLGPEGEEMLDVLLGSAQAQLQLINSLLDMTRIETGDMILSAEPFNAGAAVDAAVRLLAPDARRKGLSLVAEVAPEAREAHIGDALAFGQIVANLVGNALKFTAEGEVRVTLQPSVGQGGHGGGGGEGGGHGLTLVIADTGCGIDPADQERIFERFVQVDGSLNRRAGGAGLGLAVTRSLIELMGGTISVASRLGEGSVFTVGLPLARAAAPAGRLAA